MTQIVKNLSAMWETWVRSLGWDDPLEEGMGPTPVFLQYSSSIQYTPAPTETEEPGGLQSTGSQRVGHDWATKHSTYINLRRIDILKYFLNENTVFPSKRIIYFLFISVPSIMISKHSPKIHCTFTIRYTPKSWRKKWQPIPIFLSRIFHGQRRLEGYSPESQRVRPRLSD